MVQKSCRSCRTAVEQHLVPKLLLLLALLLELGLRHKDLFDRDLLQSRDGHGEGGETAGRGRTSEEPM